MMHTMEKHTKSSSRISVLNVDEFETLFPFVTFFLDSPVPKKNHSSGSVEITRENNQSVLCCWCQFAFHAGDRGSNPLGDAKIRQ